MITCDMCDGLGIIEDPTRTIHRLGSDEIKCPMCNGRGSSNYPKEKEMTRYIIERREICPRCNGKGYYENPVWAEFYEDPANAKATANMAELWMITHCYMNPYDEFPPDEVPCLTCDGSGELIDTVNDAVFIAERGLVTSREVDAMITEAFSNVMSALEISPSRAEVQAMIAAVQHALH